MLLNRLRQVRDDSGAALAAVLGLMMVLAVVSLTVLSAALGANAFSTATRASVQSRAAAQAGLDAVFAAVSRGSFVCSASSSVAPLYTATAVYSDKTGAALGCSGGLVAGRPAKAVVTSTGTATAKGVKASNGDTATASATFAITITNPPTQLRHALFADKSVVLNNGTNLLESTAGANDSSLYTNGGITCSTQFQVQGDMVAAGDIGIANTCNVTGAIWAGGNVTISQSALLGGDVYQAGTGQMTLGNSSSHIAGSVITNGTVNFSGSGSACSGGAGAAICGSVVAFGSGANTVSAPVGGSVYAAGSVADGSGIAKDLLSTSGNLTGTGTVGGTARAGGLIGIPKANIAGSANSCDGSGTVFPLCPGPLTFPAPNPATTLPATLGYPSGTPKVNAPLVEQLPQIGSSSSALDLWTGWTVQSVPCANVGTTLGSAWSGKLLLVVTGCTGPLPITSLQLSGDLAIMSPAGITIGNSAIIASADGARHDLLLIVPSDAPGISWSPMPSSPAQYSPSCSTSAPAQSITTGNSGTSTDTNWFLYSPCTVNVGGRISGFQGEIYGGTVLYPNNTDLHMWPMSVPGVAYPSAPPPATYSAVVSSRFMAGG